MKPISPAEALNKAAAYCTLCERCISEVSKKLTTWVYHLPSSRG